MKTFNSNTVQQSRYPFTFAYLLRSLYKNRYLILQISKREILGKYKGSLLGLAWSFFNPLFMLVIYTFVFSVIFKSRWGNIGEDTGKVQFSIILFVGMIVVGFFNEVLNRSPSVILSNINLVKKVIFPLEILPLIPIGAALFHSLISILVLLIFFMIIKGFIYWTVIFFPLVFFPLLVVVLGLSWILSSVGTYLRDIAQVTSLTTTILMFISPIFYPITAVPERFRPFIMLNPVTFIIEQSRNVLIFGILPDWKGLCIYALLAIIIAWIGFFWFQNTREGFADVL